MKVLLTQEIQPPSVLQLLQQVGLEYTPINGIRDLEFKVLQQEHQQQIGHPFREQ